LLCRLHRGQPRCRRLRGAAGAPSLPSSSPADLPPFFLASPVLAPSSSSSANGPGPPYTSAYDRMCGASRSPRIERGIGFPRSSWRRVNATPTRILCRQR
jgi:hypothetical protein